MTLYKKANNKEADQTKQKCRLICAFLVHPPHPHPEDRVSRIKDHITFMCCPLWSKWVPHATHMGFPTWVHGPLLQIPYHSHLDYYYGTHIISHDVIEKKMLLTVIFNRHINKAIHVILIHGFWTWRIHILRTSQEVRSGKVGLY